VKGKKKVRNIKNSIVITAIVFLGITMFSLPSFAVPFQQSDDLNLPQINLNTDDDSMSLAYEFLAIVNEIMNRQGISINDQTFYAGVSTSTNEGEVYNTLRSILEINEGPPAWPGSWSGDSFSLITTHKDGNCIQTYLKYHGHIRIEIIREGSEEGRIISIRRIERQPVKRETNHNLEIIFLDSEASSEDLSISSTVTLNPPEGANLVILDYLSFVERDYNEAGTVHAEEKIMGAAYYYYYGENMTGLEPEYFDGYRNYNER